MSCPKCHTAGSYAYHRAPMFTKCERAPTDQPIFDELFRIVKRPVGTGKWRCLYCHYEKTNDVSPAT